MTLYLIGAGLNDIKDLSTRALDKIRECDQIYFEYYTSLYNSTKEEIEFFLGKEVIFSNRKLMEESGDIINNAKEKNIAVLIIGDVFAATTHIQIFKEARHHKIPVEVIHNGSVLTAVGITGLELYKFGKTTSIPYPEENHFPTTPYDVAVQNHAQGLHTLFLLDLRPDQNLFMSVKEALGILLKIENQQKKKLIGEETKFVTCSHLGTEKPAIFYGTIDGLKEKDFGNPPHCLILPGKLHFVEEEMLDLWE